MVFTISIANIHIGINSLFDEVFDLCQDYLTEEKPDFFVHIEEKDIGFEREKARREAAYEHRTFFVPPDPYLETLAVYRKIAVNILQFDAFLMHGAVIGLNGSAYMFTAPSGVGKTTHTNFWLQTFSDAFIINGDKPILRFENKKAFACGTPWAGKEGLNKNISLPLKSICILTRGEQNEIAPIDFQAIYPILIGQTFRPKAAEDVQKTLMYIKRLSENTKFYLLKCNLDPNAAKVAFEGMNG